MKAKVWLQNGQRKNGPNRILHNPKQQVNHKENRGGWRDKMVELPKKGQNKIKKYLMMEWAGNAKKRVNSEDTWLDHSVTNNEENLPGTDGEEVATKTRQQQQKSIMQLD